MNQHRFHTINEQKGTDCTVLVTGEHIVRDIDDNVLYRGLSAAMARSATNLGYIDREEVLAIAEKVMELPRGYLVAAVSCAEPPISNAKIWAAMDRHIAG